MRLLRALAWLRWRLLINALKGGRRRDPFERFSRLLAFLIPILLALLLLPTVILLSLAALMAGWLVGKGALPAAPLLLVARLVLFVAFGVVVLIPIGRSTISRNESQSRFLLLPIPTRLLHALEVAAGLADPWIGALVLPLLMLPAGLLAAGQIAGGVEVLCAGVAFILTLVCLSAAASFLLQWVLRDRRRGETLTILVVVALSLLGLLPNFIMQKLDHRVPAAPPGAPSGTGTPDYLNGEIDRRLPSCAGAVPSELYTRAIRQGVEGRTGPGTLPLAGLLFEAVSLFALSAIAHRRLLEAPEGGRSRRGAAGAPVRLLRLPGLTSAASAVATAHLRAVLRTVRGRMAVYFTAPIVLVLSIVFRRLPADVPWSRSVDGGGYLVAAAGVVFGLMSLQPILMNQFAIDRAGLTMQFLAPIAGRDLVRGKAAGCGLMLLICWGLCLVAALVTAPGGPLFLWLAVLAGGAAAFLALAPIAALLSTLFPKASDLSRIGAPGNPHGAAAFIGSLSTMAALAPGAVIVGVARFLDRPALGLLLAVLWAAVAAAVASTLLGPIARLVDRRRENLALVADER